MEKRMNLLRGLKIILKIKNEIYLLFNFFLLINLLKKKKNIAYIYLYINLIF
jgi:hypothetical protein